MLEFRLAQDRPSGTREEGNRNKESTGQGEGTGQRGKETGQRGDWKKGDNRTRVNERDKAGRIGQWGTSKYTRRKLLWDELKLFSGDMMFNILDDGEKDKEMCSSLDSKEEKELCELLLRIFFWMDGLKQIPSKEKVGRFPWVQREKVEEKDTTEQEALKSYYRCLLGKVTILNMLGKHCKLKEVTPLVTKGRDEMRTTMNLNGGNKFCKDVDFGSLYLGKKFMWEEIKKGIDDFKREDDNGVGLSKVEKGQSKLHTIRNEGQNRRICPQDGNLDKEILEKLEIKVTKDDKDLLSLEDDNDPLGKEPSGGSKELEDLLVKAKEAKDAGGGDKNDTNLVLEIMKSLEQKFQQRIADVQRKNAQPTSKEGKKHY
ncbi:SICA-like antigen [Plasmodium coatneyi]|uniref:SICA-like antigen n=1 Tax=Plasmodium coatneyi TaxID=208452 RepID=A0A1B1E371_9APIC|nr:SICA-like antigen [Plasmodium coatneyi]ANQ09289.1 SICA-like antigen [Plasmodium coatneyi]